MISVIICSIHPELLQKAQQSIARTIGLEHEIIAFDNRESQWGICKVYNHCASQARFDFLCFVHEDVEFVTSEWGATLTRAAEPAEAGVIGVAGTQLVAKNFISWGDAVSHARWNIWAYHTADASYAHLQNNPQNEELSPVICLDGVFLFARKSVWAASPFDEDTYKGFHLYDADFSFAASRKYRNYVCQSVGIRHLSAGNAQSRSYFENLLCFQRKWRRSLPCWLPRQAAPGRFWMSAKEAANATTLILDMRPCFGLWKSLAYFVRRNTLVENLLLGKSLLGFWLKGKKR